MTIEIFEKLPKGTKLVWISDQANQRFKDPKYEGLITKGMSRDTDQIRVTYFSVSLQKRVPSDVYIRHFVCPVLPEPEAPGGN